MESPQLYQLLPTNISWKKFIVSEKTQAIVNKGWDRGDDTLNVRLSTPVAISYNRIVRSPDTEVTNMPFGEETTILPQQVQHLSVCIAAPVAVSHDRTVQLYSAEATSLPSGEKTTSLVYSVWPLRVYTSAFHSNICGRVLSQLNISSSS